LAIDAPVFAAYGWDPAISDDELLKRLLQLNLERAGGRTATDNRTLFQQPET
jgi:hypothetical protein